MRFFIVESVSMEPTLLGGDRLVAIRQKEYLRGDIVIVRDPLERNGYLVKRVIGVSGDTVEIKLAAVFVNGQYLSEPYRPEPIDYTMSPYLVPQNFVFVLGDNSNFSVDSHNWAAAIRESDAIVPRALPLDSVIARAFLQYYPVGRMRRIRHYPLSEQIEMPPARTTVARPLQ
jgi:signal peptidase I